MSDDDEIVYKKPQKTIHYGSLENSEWLKTQNIHEDIQSDDDDDYESDTKKPATMANPVVAPNTSGNINISSEYFDLEQEMYVFLFKF